MLLLIHILAAILGIISSTLRSVLLLKKGALDPRLQKITWILLLILTAAGISLAFAKPALFHDPKFLTKMFFVGALFAAEIYLTFRKSKPAIFASLFSWYFSFFWSGLERFQIGYLGVLGVYLSILIFGVFTIKKFKTISPNFKF